MINFRKKTETATAASIKPAAEATAPRAEITDKPTAEKPAKAGAKGAGRRGKAAGEDERLI